MAQWVYLGDVLAVCGSGTGKKKNIMLNQKMSDKYTQSVYKRQGIGAGIGLALLLICAICLL